MKKIFAISFAMIILFAGCSLKIPKPDSSADGSDGETAPAPPPAPSDSSSSAPDASTPDGAAEILLEKVSDLDNETIRALASQYFSVEQLPEAFYSLLEPMSKRVTYKIGNFKIDGDSAVVDVSITSVDAQKALHSIMPGAVAHLAALQISGKDISEPEKILSEYAAKNIKWDELPTIKTDSTLYMVKGADGEWKVDASNPDNLGFANAISGGAIDVVQNLKSFAERFQ